MNLQIYVSDLESTIFRPSKELKWFEKIFLSPGEEKRVGFVLNKYSFAYYNVNIKDWHVEEGIFQIQVGASSRNIKLKANIYVMSSQREVKVPDYKSSAPAYYYFNQGDFEVSDSEFKAVYGKDLPPAKRLPGEKYIVNSTMKDISTTFLGKWLMKVMKEQAIKITGGDIKDEFINRLIEVMLLESPLRSIVIMSSGTVTLEMVNGLVKLINRRYLSEISLLLKSFLKGKSKKF